MTETEPSAEQVASAFRDALQNEALQEAVLVFGAARIVLTKGQRIEPSEPADAEVVPAYPVVETSLVDQANTWLS